VRKQLSSRQIMFAINRLNFEKTTDPTQMDYRFIRVNFTKIQLLVPL
jgi:hypothetical protein